MVLFLQELPREIPVGGGDSLVITRYLAEEGLSGCTSHAAVMSTEAMQGSPVGGIQCG